MRVDRQSSGLPTIKALYQKYAPTEQKRQSARDETIGRRQWQ
jgi:hypothetical protein